jgi:hypothetical protein
VCVCVCTSAYALENERYFVRSVCVCVCGSRTACIKPRCLRPVGVCNEVLKEKGGSTRAT